MLLSLTGNKSGVKRISLGRGTVRIVDNFKVDGDSVGTKYSIMNKDYIYTLIHA